MVEETRHPDSSAGPAGGGGPSLQPGEPRHPEVDYERTDVSFGGVFVVIMAAAVIGVIVLLVVWRFFVDYNRHQSAIKQSPYPVAREPSANLPPEPRLEQLDRMAGNEKPHGYLREESKEAILHSAGTTSEQGFAHIPVERAMRMLINKLPVRKETQQRGPVKDNGLLDSGEPNSGRLLREEGR